MRNRSRGWLKCQLGENPLNRSAIHEKSRKACELTQGEDIVYSPTKISGNRGYKGMRKRYSSQPDRPNGTNALTLRQADECHGFLSTQRTRPRTSVKPPINHALIAYLTKSSPTNSTLRKSNWAHSITKN